MIAAKTVAHKHFYITGLQILPFSNQVPWCPITATLTVNIFCYKLILLFEICYAIRYYALHKFDTVVSCPIKMRVFTGFR